MKFPEIVAPPVPEDKRIWRYHKEPFAIYFVYTPDGNYVVKGNNWDCHFYINNTFPKCFYRYTFWQDGKSRGGWQASKGIYIAHKDLKYRAFLENNYYNYPPFMAKPKYYITIYTADGIVELKGLRRMPHKWLPVMDKAIPPYEYERIQKEKQVLVRPKDTLRGGLEIKTGNRDRNGFFQL